MGAVFLVNAFDRKNDVGEIEAGIWLPTLALKRSEHWHGVVRVVKKILAFCLHKNTKSLFLYAFLSVKLINFYKTFA